MPGYVYVDSKDIHRLAKQLDMTLDAFGARYLRKVEGKLSLIEAKNCDCVFWNDDSGCQVYRARPRQCRQFPFWPENLAVEANWQEEAESCPGMDKGRLYEVEAIHRIRDGSVGTRSGRKRKKKLPSV